LLEKGYDNLIILEAENRFGGRVHSIPFSTGIIDLGGQWVQGQKGNVIYELYKDIFEFGSSGFDEYPEFYLRSDGILPDQDKYSKLGDYAMTLLLDTDLSQQNISFGQFIEEKIEAALLTNPDFKEIDAEIVEQVKRSAYSKSNSYYASETMDDVGTSILSFLAEDEGKLDLTWRDKGYATVFDLITVSNNAITDVHKSLINPKKKQGHFICYQGLIMSVYDS
jgi:spermine oxidase